MRHLAGKALVGHGDVSCPGKFDVVRRAEHQPDGNAGPFGDGRIVGEVGAARLESALVRGKDRLEGKALRGLRRMQATARHGFRHRPVEGFFLERIGDGQRRQRAVLFVDARNGPVDDLGADEGPHAIMDEHGRRLGFLQGKQRKTRRILPCRAADDSGDPRGEFAGRGREQLAVVGMDGDRHRADTRMFEERLQRMPDHGLAADLAILLWPVCLASTFTPSGGDDHGGDG